MLDPANFVLEDQQAELARTYVDVYLQHHGLTFARLGNLPPAEREQVMMAASVFASLNLAAIEERARVVHSLHHVSEAVEIT